MLFRLQTFGRPRLKTKGGQRLVLTIARAWSRMPTPTTPEISVARRTHFMMFGGGKNPVVARRGWRRGDLVVVELSPINDAQRSLAVSPTMVIEAPTSGGGHLQYSASVGCIVVNEARVA